ncbi:prolipoprotein diacylglyceryl transferase [Ditylenchus destructor]|nr:prolipoprotein diacylglyceryl transferase [Ditylenchus destructor]
MLATLLPASALAFPNIDPVIFSIGPLAVHWYGLGYVVGIMFRVVVWQEASAQPSPLGAQSAAHGARGAG